MLDQLLAVRDEYAVRIAIRESNQAGVNIWPVLLSCAVEICQLGGNGTEFIRRAVPHIYAVMSTKNSLPKFGIERDATDEGQYLMKGL